MAKLGTAQAANRYDGISVGTGVLYSFETQEGLPVDSSNASLRDMSPFTLRFVLPTPLLVAAGVNERDGALASRAPEELRDPSIFTRAYRTNDNNTQYRAVRNALNQVLPGVGSSSEQIRLQGFATQDQFLTATDAKVAQTLATAASAADLVLQVRRMLDAPPLTLLINPAEMSISYTNVQNYSTRVRTGYVFERWGEEQPTISFSGSTGGFVAGVGESPGNNPFITRADRNRETDTVSGLQPASMRDSAAWQNFMSFYQFYRNNGYIYDQLGLSEAHLMVGAIAIDYDQWTYVGHISSFEYSFAEDSPHRVEWSIEFVVDRMYDNATSPTVVSPYTAPTPSPSDPVWSGRARGRTPSIAGPNTTGTERATSEFAGNVNQSEIPFDFTG